MLTELQVMKSMQPHPHVVRLIGCCTEKGTGLITTMNLALLLTAIFLVLKKVKLLRKFREIIRTRALFIF